ncbi:MAG: ribulose-phosphate 3-epimerase [Clostridia bacterium]|nr:ribulose-phosphate 3-epimerase [Clostridia bacterium]
MFKNIPKISYSLLASCGQNKKFKETLVALSNIGIDLIHYDVSENEKTLSLDDLSLIYQYTDLPFEVHLSVKNPEMYISKVNMRKKDYFCIHVENKYNLSQLKELKQKLGCNFGLAINVDTPVDALFYAVPEIDYVLFMAAEPGVSGGTFNENVVEKIQQFKQRYPHTKIHVDGGINNLSAALLREVGIDVLVSGSYILKDNNYSKQVAKLVGQNLNLPLRAIMRCGDELPKVLDESSVNEVAFEIDTKRIGCTCVVNKKNQFLGLITDTDIRKFLINRIDLTNLQARDIMNPRPYIANPDKTLISVLRKLEQKGLSFTVVPVVAENKQCLGIIRLQDILFRNVLGLRIRHL